MPLLPNEKIMVKGTDGFPTLTSHRVWQLSEAGSDKQLRAIMLEDLCSCSLTYQEKPQWMWLAILSGIFGVFAAISQGRDVGGILVGAAVVVVVFFLLYMGSKQQYVTLSAASGRIAIQIPRDDFDRCTAFVESRSGSQE